jgi:hypothetical protein
MILLSKILNPLLALYLIIFVGCASHEYRQNLRIDLKPVVRQVIQKSRQQKLSHHEYWHRLLHIDESTSPESDLRGDFFIDPQGSSSPQAELEATLQAFFFNKKEEEVWQKNRKDLFKLHQNHNDQGKPSANSKTKSLIKDVLSPHPICRFPARFIWLREHLKELNHLKAPVCPGLTKFLERTQLQSATLVFSAHHLKSPASAYGHTFLRLNHTQHIQGQKYDHKKLDLLDTGVGYSAIVDEANPILYAVKGLMGSFPGTFNVYPYYYKVREYNDYEARDLWEYDLNLTPLEVGRIALHLWEMGRTWAPYYYLSNNCSYEMLRLLELARPNVKLLEKLQWPILPVNTLKVAKEAGLVKNVLFRPSIRSTLTARINQSSSNAVDLAWKLSQKEVTNTEKVSHKDQAHAFDLVLDYLDLKYPDEILLKNDKKTLEQRYKYLQKRAELETPSLKLDYSFLSQVTPESGHASRRIEVLGGWSPHEKSSIHLNTRFNLHSLSDLPYGYPDSIQLQFFSIKTRYLIETQQYRLGEIILLNALSLSRFHKFEPRLSWNIQTGIRERNRKSCFTCLVGYLDFDSGITLANLSEKISWILFSSIQLEGGSSIETKVPLTFALGARSGLRFHIAEHHVFLFTGQFIHWFFEPDSWSTQMRGVFRFGLSQNVALTFDARLLSLDLSHSAQLDEELHWRAQMGLSIYF